MEWELGVGVEKAKKRSKEKVGNNGKTSKRKSEGERTSKNN